VRDPIKFGNYYLFERVNIGGMAEVFKAVSYGVEGFERLYAIKRVLPNIAEDQEFIDMFIDEAKIAVQLNHANIGQIFELGRDQKENAYFIAMEFVQGKDLRAMYDRARKRGEVLDIAMCCHIVKEACEALEYAHNKKGERGEPLHLVHRDVSPQNLIVSYDGEVKLIDFGIAKAAGKASKTQSGILKGKFGYMSPEQVRGRPSDKRSDLFSLGVVLFELLTLERCFQGESDFSVLEKVRNSEIRRPSTLNRPIPPELERIVMKGLARNPDERYQSAAELQDALQKFLYQSGTFYARKDLAAYMRRTFDADIRNEANKLAEFREYARQKIPEAKRASVPVPALPAEPERPAAQFSPQLPSLSWEDDEVETAVWDRAPSQIMAAAALNADPPAFRNDARPQPPERVTPKPPRGSGPPGDAQRKPAAANVAPTMPAIEAIDPIPLTGGRRSAAVGNRIVALAVITLVTLGLAGVAIFWFTRGASLVVESKSPQAVRVELDGKVVHDAQTPVELPDLPPGTHQVRISAPGFEPAERTMELRARVQDRLVVTLRPVVRASAATGLNVQTEPGGAQVYVDGQLAPDVTPTRVTGIASGVRELRIEKTGFLPWKGTVEARDGVVVNVKPIRLFPERVSVQFVTDPSGARITLRQADGREAYLGESSVFFNDLENRGTAVVIAEKPGYERVERRLGQYESGPATEFIPLPKASAAPAVARVAPPPQPSRAAPPRPAGGCVGEDCPSGAPPAEPQRVVVVAPPPTAAAPVTAPAAPAGEGTLKLLAKPPARVEVAGRDLGWTPLIDHRLPAGTYHVRLVRDQEPGKYTHEFDVTIVPGQTTFRKHIADGM
jgi:serine/threonine protein kinase